MYIFQISLEAVCSSWNSMSAVGTFFEKPVLFFTFDVCIFLLDPHSLKNERHTVIWIGWLVCPPLDLSIYIYETAGWLFCSSFCKAMAIQGYERLTLSFFKLWIQNKGETLHFRGSLGLLSFTRKVLAEFLYIYTWARL